MSYTAFIDDSGSDGTLWDEKGEPRVTKQRILCVGTLLVRNEAVPRVEAFWRGLLNDISNTLEAPPESIPVHMRLMYGRRISEYIDGKKKIRNPFFDATPEQRLKWMTRAIRTLRDFNLSGQLFLLSLTKTKEDHYNQQAAFLKSPEHQRELAYLRQAAFDTGDVDLFGKLHAVLANPLTSLIAETLEWTNQYADTFKLGQIDVVYDSSQSSKGIATGRAYELIVGDGGLPHLGRVDPGNQKDDILLQAADVCVHRVKRLAEVALGLDDPLAVQWVKRYGMPYRQGSGPDLPRPDRYNVLLLHYQLAHETVASMNSQFASDHLVGIDEFQDRCKGLGDGHLGVSILKNPVKELW